MLAATAKPAAAISRAARLVLADGTVFEGHGFGAATAAVGEVCFNTAMTGYQEILTDPSYAGQIVCLHLSPYRHRRHQRRRHRVAHARWCAALIVRADAEHPSNYRALSALDRWLKRHNIPAHRRHRHARADQPHPRDRACRMAWSRMRRTAIRRRGADEAGARISGPGRSRPRQGRHLAPDATTGTRRPGRGTKAMASRPRRPGARSVIDYGVKRNILRMLAGMGADITVVPAQATFDDVMRHKPHGVLLSNGPGDPAATGAYAIPTIKGADRHRTCRCSASASAIRCWAWRWARKTRKMAQGHHGANHPVKDLETGKVEIVSMNHGFTVDRDTSARGRQGNACLAVRRHQLRHRASRASRCSACSTTPKPRPARWIRTICSSASPRPRKSARLAVYCYAEPSAERGIEAVWVEQGRVARMAGCWSPTSAPQPALALSRKPEGNNAREL